MYIKRFSGIHSTTYSKNIITAFYMAKFAADSIEAYREHTYNINSNFYIKQRIKNTNNCVLWTWRSKPIDANRV